MTIRSKIVATIATILLATSAYSSLYASDVKWFQSVQVDEYAGGGTLPGTKVKPFGDDLRVTNPHIKDWFMQTVDANGNIVMRYNYSVIRFTDAQGQTYSITFSRNPVSN